MDTELNKLINFIAEHYPFEAPDFPQLENASEDEKMQFALRHIALHFSKTTGKITTAVEPADHGGKVDMELLKQEVTKQLITTLRLAELLKVPAKDLLNGIESKYKDKL